MKPQQPGISLVHSWIQRASKDGGLDIENGTWNVVKTVRRGGGEVMTRRRKRKREWAGVELRIGAGQEESSNFIRVTIMGQQRRRKTICKSFVRFLIKVRIRDAGFRISLTMQSKFWSSWAIAKVYVFDRLRKFTVLRGMEVTGDGEMKTHVCVCVLEGEDRSKDNAAYTVIGIGIVRVWQKIFHYSI